MPISVQNQDASHAHSITRRLSQQILAAGLARISGQDRIQLTTELPFAEVKRLARGEFNPWAIAFRLNRELPIRDYPAQMTCMEAAFQRCMRYPVELAKDQTSAHYSWERVA